MARSTYDPATYPAGVPNPLGPRVHAWNDYSGAYGTRYHGGVWTRPQQRFGYAAHPLSGVVGLGLAEVPWPCWDVPGFSDCHVACQSAGAAECQGSVPGGLPYWVDRGYASLQECVDDLGRACDFQQCIPAHCPEHAPVPRQGTTRMGMPGPSKQAWLVMGGVGLGMLAVAVYLNRRK